jgi:hypothetical protein
MRHLHLRASDHVPVCMLDAAMAGLSEVLNANPAAACSRLALNGMVSHPHATAAAGA